MLSGWRAARWPGRCRVRCGLRGSGWPGRRFRGRPVPGRRRSGWCPWRRRSGRRSRRARRSARPRRPLPGRRPGCGYRGGWRGRGRVRGAVRPASLRGVLHSGGHYMTPFPGFPGPAFLGYSGGSAVWTTIPPGWRSRQAVCAFISVTWTAESSNLPISGFTVSGTRRIAAIARRRLWAFPGAGLRIPREQGAMAAHSACAISGGAVTVRPAPAARPWRGHGRAGGLGEVPPRPRRPSPAPRSPWPASPGLARDAGDRRDTHLAGQAPRRASAFSRHTSEPPGTLATAIIHA